MKKPFIYLLTAGLAFSMISNTKNTEAAESNATVNFEVPTDSVDVLDPRNPLDLLPDIEKDGNETGETGPLTLDYVSHLDFGTSEITTSEKIYPSETELPFVQVSDRRATGEGWLLTAQADNFTGTREEDDGTVTQLGNTLPSSTISFLNGEAVSTSTTGGPEVKQDIELVTGGAPVNVANAEEKVDDGALDTAEGLGTWIMEWISSENNPDAAVNLMVPESAATVGNHSSTITWTLENGPTTEALNPPTTP